MNDQQKLLYKALELIANSITTIDSAIEALDDPDGLMPKQVEEVLDEYEKNISTFDRLDLEHNGYNFTGAVNNLMRKIFATL